VGIVLLLSSVVLGARATLARAGADAEPPPLEDALEPPPRGAVAPPLIAAQPPLAYRGAWEMRWGESPLGADGQPLWASPSSRSAEWQDLRPLHKLSGPAQGRTLWLRTRLSGQMLPEPVLFLYSVDQIFEAYLDGEPIYRFGEFSGPRALRFSGLSAHFIPLEPPRVGQPQRRVNYEGKVLALRIYSAHRNIGVAGIPLLGTRSEVVRQLFLDDLGRFVVGWMLLLLGAGGVCLFLVRPQERVLLAYGSFGLAMGVYTLTQLEVRELLWSGPLIWTHVELWSLHLAPLCLCWFIELMFGRGPFGVMRLLRRLSGVQALLAALLVLGGLVSVMSTLLPLQLAIVIDVLAVSTTVLLAAVRGNVEARIFAGGLLVAAAICLHDVLVAMNVIVRTDGSWSQYANGAMMLALAGVLGRRIQRVHQRLRDYTQVLQTSLASTRVLVPDERAQVALEQMAQLLSARRALLFLLPEGKDQLELRAGHDVTGRPVDVADTFEQGVADEVLSRGRALVREGPRSDRRGGRSVLAAPLLFRGALLGVLVVERGRSLQEDDSLDLLLGLANQVAIVVASSRAMQAEVEAAMTRQRFNEQRALLDAAVRMASGDLSTPILVPIGSPYAHLAESLESMRQDVWTKILQLETKNREVQMLNLELRRQIAARSRRLIGAILRQQGGKAAPLPDLSPGRVIVGRYRVNRMLGQGAMGVVLEVERIADGRRLAAKFVSQRADQQSLLRFVREAQILARLSHPNLIAIFDVDMTAGGVLFMVMELVVGSPLDALRKRYGQLPWALCVLHQIADALAAIHAAGIVHRDLKPANVLVAGGDKQPLPVIKLADFGVSLLLPGPLAARPHKSEVKGSSKPGVAASPSLLESEDDELDDFEPTMGLEVSGLDSPTMTLPPRRVLPDPGRPDARTVTLSAPSPQALAAASVPPPPAPPPVPTTTVPPKLPEPPSLPPPVAVPEVLPEVLEDPFEPPTLSLLPGQSLQSVLPDEPSLAPLDPPTMTLKPAGEPPRAPSSVSLSLPPRVPELQPMSLPKASPALDSLAADPSEITFGSLSAAEVTQSGILIGTPMYMAPENWAHGSHRAEPSSDLFSLGVMAFELLSGQLPFSRPPIHARAQDEDVQVLRLGDVRPELAPALCALVDRCLSLTPDERPSAAEFAHKLLELGAQRPQA
jgi:serine/threonine protein kinase